MGNEISKVQSFLNWQNDVKNAQVKILDDIQNGTISTEEQRNTRHTEMANMSFDVLSDEYRNLANKKNKTPEETKRMMDLYKTGFIDFGKSYKTYIDKKFGNGDGKLTMDEFVKSENDLPDTKAAENFFKHIDFNSNGDIDEKEMAALMIMFDMSIGTTGEKGGSLNGKIKAADLEGNVLNLIKPQTDNMGRAIQEKFRGLYNYFFGKN